MPVARCDAPNSAETAAVTTETAMIRTLGAIDVGDTPAVCESPKTHFHSVVKPDFMIPISFQSDMGHIHRKAGFTHGGK